MNASKLELSLETQSKWEALLSRLNKLQSVVVGFSGGVDSGLLSVAAYQALGNKMLAVTIKTPVETHGTIEIATALALQFHFPHQIIEFNDLDDIDFVSNHPDRCYHCKQIDFGIIKKIAQEGHYQYVLDGTNSDDLSDYRPGRKAAEELQVLSPLQDLGLKKSHIREIGKALQMVNWDRPSSPCLASRFPYGIKITREGLEKVAAGEEFLQNKGFRIVRVRYGGSMVRIEVAPNEIDHLIQIRPELVTFFKELGIKYVVADLEGYRQGSLNEVLDGIGH